MSGDYTRSQLIESYRLYWDLDNRFGGFIIRPEGGDTFHIRATDATEFMAFSDLLRNEKPLYFDPRRKLIQTGPEPVGEEES